MPISGVARNAKHRKLSEVVAGVAPRTQRMKRNSAELALVALESSILAQVEAELQRKEPRLSKLIQLHAWMTRLIKSTNLALAEETKANGGVAPADVDGDRVGDAGQRLMDALALGDEDADGEPADS